MLERVEIRMAKVIMVQGTMSNAGKTFICAGLCRVFKQDGYRVAPFKSQNMALNSFITKEGLEMGRAQVMQAEAAGIEPNVAMNPILLKPTSNMGSQVIVNGEVYENMSAKEYFSYKKELIPEIMKAYHKLEEQVDIIVIEGAGSPAEINLKNDDIVNMGMAKLVDAPVLLVGDIDRGGVFAQIYGTIELLEPEEKERIKGIIINKFRGDKSILEPGLAMLYDKCKIPVTGVLPYEMIDIDDEDSLADRLNNESIIGKKETVDTIMIKVIKFPRISNFTDFNALGGMEGVSVQYVDKVSELEGADMIVLPGSKNTIQDLLWMRQNGIEAKIKKCAANDTLIWGICGGYQMLGEKLNDDLRIENSEKTEVNGIGLLSLQTFMENEKVRTRIEGMLPDKIEGAYEKLGRCKFEGYEIHMGRTVKNQTHGSREQNEQEQTTREQETQRQNLHAWKNNVFGTYVHGIFDSVEMRKAVYNIIAGKKGLKEYGEAVMSMQEYKELQYDKLADSIRNNIDMKAVYQMMGIQR